MVGHDRQWQYNFTAQGGDSFELIYDTKTMHKDGVEVTVQGEGGLGAQEIDVEDDKTGTLKVRVGQTADGKKVSIFVHPAGTSVRK